ncbi:alpha/beta fold hydrolase [Actinomadura formosensis]|uniref:alpha/beta fold hydrolase n=1 Tax=Actinomadura formosensis TaxID=60706 RepID=UPI0008313BCC|nr:alpha/beta hydrolase [Actinomadura formosensis]
MTGTVTEAPAERVIHLKKFRVRYREAGTGHPVVLLHGSGPGATGLTNFSPNIGPLARRFRVLAIDMPGWGDSDTQTAETGYDHAGVLVEFLDALGIGTAALVGNSMGGMTSIEAATRHPDRISHLITMGVPAPVHLVFSPGDGPSEGLAALFQAYRDPSPANMRRLVEVMVYDNSFATDELAEARSRAALDKPEHLASWNDRIDAQQGFPYFSLGTQVRGITAPTLLIHGRDDRVVSYENSLHLVSLIPDSRLVLLNRCGHWAQIEHAAEFNRTVESFIAATG